MKNLFLLGVFLYLFFFKGIAQNTIVKVGNQNKTNSVSHSNSTYPYHPFLGNTNKVISVSIQNLDSLQNADSINNFIKQYILFEPSCYYKVIKGLVKARAYIGANGKIGGVKIVQSFRPDFDTAVALILGKIPPIYFSKYNPNLLVAGSMVITLNINVAKPEKNNKLTVGIPSYGLLCYLDGSLVHNPLVDNKRTWFSQFPSSGIAHARLIKPKDAIGLFGSKGRYGAYEMFSDNAHKAVSIQVRLNYVLDHSSDTSLRYSESRIDSIKNTFLGYQYPKLSFNNQGLLPRLPDQDFANYYPHDAHTYDVMGRVLLSYKVDKKGKIGDIVVQSGKDLGGDLADAAIEIIKSSPHHKYIKDGNITEASFHNVIIEFQDKYILEGIY